MAARKAVRFRWVRAVLQRVLSASVSVDGFSIAEINGGLLVLLGVAEGDASEDAERLAKKTAELRVFPDEQGRFDRSLLDVSGEALVVSQFTLLADTSRGRRPSFTAAARPDVAQPLVDRYMQVLTDQGVRVKSGRFGAHMLVQLENDGPVTIILGSEKAS
jgi:D-tyrosyl-tRNA(Tyr) deacylase